MSSPTRSAPSPQPTGPKSLGPLAAAAASPNPAALGAPAASPQSETAAKRTTQKLQRAAVDGLEDVKAQDIRVFNTEALSALFERVIVASGTSNRQTKALAASVCDAVREAGFDKPRVEGEENGEWIVVDCGAVVVHVMQPSIRQYYRLEEIWGSKPVRLKFGAPAPAARPAAVADPKASKASKAKASGAGRSAAAAKDKPTADKPKAKSAKPAKPAKLQTAGDAPKAKLKPSSSYSAGTKPAKAKAAEDAPKAKPAKAKATDKPKAKPSASDSAAAKPAKAAKPRKPAQPKA